MDPVLSLCLDFANTLSWRGREQPSEKLTSYAALVAWGRKARVLTAPEARRLLDHAKRSPERATATLEGAIAVREAIYRIFAAVAADGRAPASDLAILNDAIRDALGRLKIASQLRGFEWRWTADAEALDRMLWPVARSAAELLSSTKLEKIRVCAGAGCGWLFLDHSRNHSRRWCDMRDCGNREKARRHYQRVRETRAGSET